MSAVSAAANLLALRWIPPSVAGIWHTAMVAQSYAMLIRLGVPNGLNRELPFIEGSGDMDTARTLVAVAQWWAWLCSVVLLGLFCLSAVYWASADRQWLLALGAAGVIGGSQIQITHLQATMRAGRDWRRLAYVQFAQTALVACSPFGAYAFGFVGFCTCQALSALSAAAICYAIRPVRVDACWNRKAFSMLMTTGLRLFGSSALATLSSGSDRLALAAIGGTQAVGIFVPAHAVIGAMMLIPTAVGSYLYPTYSFRLGHGAAPADLASHWRVETLKVVVIAGALGLAMWPVISIAIQMLMPTYAAGTTAAQVAVLTGVITSIGATNVILGALKDWRGLYLFTGSGLALKLALLPLAAWSSDPVLAVTVLGCITAIAHVSIGIRATIRALRQPRPSVRELRQAV